MYTVIGHPRTRTMRVLWALEELGQPYEILLAKPLSETALKHSPSGKVPVLMFEGTPIPDSVAIMQFLADRHTGLTHPAGSLARAVQDSMTQFACEEVDGSLWLQSKHNYVLPEKLRVAGVLEAAKRDYDRAMVTLEARLEGQEFAAGDMFTVPDIVLGHCAGWAKSSGWDWPEGRVGDYFERVRARPALKAAMEKAG